MAAKKKQAASAPKKKSWEAQELADINKNWERSPLKGRPIGITRESSRLLSKKSI